MTINTSHRATGWLWPTTRIGQWTMALFGTEVVLLSGLMIALSTNAGTWDNESFFTPLWPALVLLASAACGLGATTVGLLSILRRIDRSPAVIVATALAGYGSFFFVGELLSVIGVLPGH